MKHELRIKALVLHESFDRLSFILDNDNSHFIICKITVCTCSPFPNVNNKICPASDDQRFVEFANNPIPVDHISFINLISSSVRVTWDSAITGPKGTNGNEAYFGNVPDFNNDDASHWTAS